MPCSVSRVVIRFRFTELSAQLREAGRVIRPHSGLQVRRAQDHLFRGGTLAVVHLLWKHRFQKATHLGR